MKRITPLSIAEPVCRIDLFQVSPNRMQVVILSRIRLSGIETVVRRLNLQEWCCLNLASQEVAEALEKASPTKLQHGNRW